MAVATVATKAALAPATTPSTNAISEIHKNAFSKEKI